MGSSHLMPINSIQVQGINKLVMEFTSTKDGGLRIATFVNGMKYFIDLHVHAHKTFADEFTLAKF